MRGDVIVVINVSKLLATRVLFSRATTLAQKLDIEVWAPSRLKGLYWANANYWVAYRWIPAESTEFYISVSFLRNTLQ